MVIRGRRGREQTPRACLAPMSRASYSLTPHSPGLILLRGKLRPKRCCDFPMSLNKGKGRPGGALRARVSIYRAPTVYKCCLSGVGPPSPGQQHQGLRVYPHTRSCLVPSSLFPFASECNNQGAEQEVEDMFLGVSASLLGGMGSLISSSSLAGGSQPPGHL